MHLTAINVDNLKRVAVKHNASGKRARRKLKVLNRDNFKCVTCGIDRNLTIAHIVPIRKKNRGANSYKIDNCKTQCSPCHIMEEFGKYSV